MSVTIEDTIPAYLATITGLSALISTRIYPMEIPVGATLPCVVFTRVSTPMESTHDSSGDTGDLVHPRMQFDIWAATQGEASAIARLIRRAFHGKKGTIGTAPNTLAISSLVLDHRPMPRNTENNLFGYLVDCEIWYEEAG
jgi:hypothetical protein